MAYKWGLLTTYDTWDDPPSADNVSLYFPHKLLTLGKRAMITYGEGLALVFISPATQKLRPGLVVCKYHLQIPKKPGIRSCTNENSTKTQSHCGLFQGYTGGEIYDVYFKPCNGSAPVKLGPPKETIIFQIVPGCKPRNNAGENINWGLVILPSLKLILHPPGSHPKRKFHLPTINFQWICWVFREVLLVFLLKWK